MKSFNTTEEVKKAFSIEGEVEIGSHTFNQVIKHAVIVRNNEDDLVSVQIGSLIGETITVDEDVVKQADAIHAKLTKYFSGGDHDGIFNLDLIIMDDGTYRLYGEPDEDQEEYDPFEINNASLSELLNSIHI